jgi:hypothetical protein
MQYPDAMRLNTPDMLEVWEAAKADMTRMLDDMDKAVKADDADAAYELAGMFALMWALSGRALKIVQQDRIAFNRKMN